jgi:glucose/arabinose dehydrogenase
MSPPTSAMRFLTSAALSTLVLGAVASCGLTDSTGAGTRGTVAGTAPVVSSPGGDYSGGTLPVPIAVPTLQGIALKAELIGGVFEPIALVPRNGTDKLYVAQKDGKIKQINVDRVFNRDGSLQRMNYRVDQGALLDIGRSTDDINERGLLGLAFSSDGRKMYLLYTKARAGNIVVDEYLMNDDQVDRSSRRNLLDVEHAEANNNGGQLAFGPDGFLYIGMGDGGGQGDPNKNAQNPRSLSGKILRIDPEGGTKDLPYATPAGNPFHDGQQGAPEVWAMGLRNPWRFSFDRFTKDLWIADVGQDTVEEIDFLPTQVGGAGRGANLGWNQMEGTHPFQGGTPPPGYTPPLFEYGRTNGACSVIGGYVYRGKLIWPLLGVYVYADYCNGEVRGLLRKPDNKLEDAGFGIRVPNGLLEHGGSVTSFGEDNDGELFILSAAGNIYKIQVDLPPK